MESLKGGVVEADHRTNGGTLFVNLRLTVELRPSGVEVPHLGEHVRSNLVFVA